MWMIHGAAPPLEMSVLPGHAAFAFLDGFCWDFQNTPPKTSGTSYTCLVRENFACFCPPELHRDTDSPVISVTNGTDDFACGLQGIYHKRSPGCALCWEPCSSSPWSSQLPRPLSEGLSCISLLCHLLSHANQPSHPER